MAEVSFKLTSADSESMAKMGKWLFSMITRAIVAGPVIITLGRETRTKEQNRKLWPMCTDFEPVLFNGRLWKKEDWKCFLISAFRKEMPVVGLLGEPVSISLKTSSMGKKDFSEFIEFIYSEGARWGVVWSEQSLEVYEEYREAQLH
jgi:hypothetical protein